MAWNEPGGNKNDNDPWGTGGRRGNDQGPPDLDEALKKGLDKLNKLFGGKGKKGGGGGSQGSDSGGGGVGYGAILAIFAILAVGFALYQSVYTVDEKERAVVLRFGEYYTTKDPGLQFKVPLIDRITKVRVTSLRSAESRGQMLTEDQNLVSVELQVQYRVDNARNYVINVRDSNQALAFATDSALRHEVGNAQLDEVLTEGRAALAINVEQRLQTFLKDYGTGLRIVKVNLESTQPPEPVQEAFREVQRAKEDEQRLVEEAETYRNKVVPEARGRAQRLLEEANAYKEQVIERANGETARFLELLGVYADAPQVTRDRMYIDAMQKVFSSTSKVLVDTESSGNIMYLPLDRLMRQRSDEDDSSMNGGSASSDANIQSMTDEVLREIQQRNRNANGRRGR
jgi:membrane protease subunit HflK